MAAFYDDSGGFNPEDRVKFACFGMCVIPTRYIRECGDAWWGILEKHFQFSGSLQINGIEAKSSELHNMLRSLGKKSSLNEVQQKLFDHGLNTTTKVNNLIEAIWGFLARPPTQIKYLAVIAHKKTCWLGFRTTQFNQWDILRQSSSRRKANLKVLRGELEAFLVKHTYEYLLQRLQYLGEDPDFDFSDAFVIGDQTSRTKVMLETQAGIQSGLGKFSDLPAIVNRTWFGSSLYDAHLQIADWIAFAVRTWAEAKEHSSRIIQLLPNFRGYPDPDKLIGRGIVLCPRKEYFPSLPLLDNIS